MSGNIESQFMELKKRADRAEGALEQVMDQLRKDFGCSTLEEAKNLIPKLTKEAERAKKDAEVALGKFQSKYGDKLP